MVIIDKLQAKNVKDYTLLTYPNLRNNLKGYCTHGNNVVLAAAYDSKPIGLIVARLDTRSNIGMIQSIFVAAAFRNQGIGTQLLLEVEKALSTKKCEYLQIRFPLSEGSFSPLAVMLQKNSWSSFVKFFEICKFKVSDYPWIYGCSFKGSEKAIPFDNITGEQLDDVKKGMNQWYPQHVSPFQSHLKDYHKDTSFWLTLNGEIIGWLVTVQVTKDTLSYERLYIREELQRTGMGIPFISYVSRKQLSLNIPYISMLINYNEPFVNLPLKQFYERKVKPYTILHKEYYISNKTLLKKEMKT